jgi:CheY-like chemotaxis protein
VSARILVVEDNPTNRTLMEYLLGAFGHTVLSATDGAEGVAVARRERPDVILMDLQLPGLNGFGALARLRADPATAGLRVIAVTAFAMVGDRDRILAAGFDGYISKPIDPETFATDVHTCVVESDRHGDDSDR